MTREEIHQEIGNLLSLMEINNNRMLLNDANAELDRDVMRGYVRKLYELLDRLSTVEEGIPTPQIATPPKEVIEEKVAEPEPEPEQEQEPEQELESEPQPEEEPEEEEAPIIAEAAKPRKRKKLKFKPEPVEEAPVAEEAPEPELEQEQEPEPPVEEKPKVTKQPVSAPKQNTAVPQDDVYAKFKYAKLDSIKKGISISKRYEIQNELFGNDPQAYNEAIRVLDGAESHEAALDYMQNTLMVTHQWDEEDALVEELKTLLIRRFM